MAECRHEIEESTCADCKPRSAPPRPVMGTWFEARFDGECAGCDGSIVAGDTIRADGEGGWLCTICGAGGDDGPFSRVPDLGDW